MQLPKLLWYIHHHGSGHLRRFQLLYKAVQENFEIVALVDEKSSVLDDLEDCRGVTVVRLPNKWSGKRLEIDSKASFFERMPYGEGSVSRAYKFCEVVRNQAPSLFYCDMSFELALLAGTMGLPTVLTLHNGDFSSNETAKAAFSYAKSLAAFFPESLADNIQYSRKAKYLGFYSRYTKGLPSKAIATDTITVINGYDGRLSQFIDKIILAFPDKKIRIIGHNQNEIDHGRVQYLGMVSDISQYLNSDVVIAAAGNNLISELVSLQKKMILVAEERPFDEQYIKAELLESAGLASHLKDPSMQSSWVDAYNNIKSRRINWSQFVNEGQPYQFAKFLSSVL